MTPLAPLSLTPTQEILTQPNHLSIAAVFATMNRRETAIECARRLATQTLPIGKLFVTDNNSDDGTSEALEAFQTESPLSIQVINRDDNVGNAGGVQQAMEMAFKTGFEAVWILDDDSWPEPRALETLLQSEGPTNGIRSSIVLAPDSEILSWPCEILDEHRRWKFERKRISIVESSGTWVRIRRSWLGSLITREAYCAVGAPNSEMFLRGEDEEYPRRLEKAGFWFWMNLHSVLRHPVAGELVTLAVGDYKLCLEKNLGNDKLYYRVRNMLWIKKEESGTFSCILLAIGYLFLVLQWFRPLSTSLSAYREAVSDAFRNRLGRRGNAR